LILTTDKRFTWLHPQKKIIKNLDSTITIKDFFNRQLPSDYKKTQHLQQRYAE